jgi:hypothetical protein
MVLAEVGIELNHSDKSKIMVVILNTKICFSASNVRLFCVGFMIDITLMAGFFGFLGRIKKSMMASSGKAL